MYRKEKPVNEAEAVEFDEKKTETRLCGFYLIKEDDVVKIEKATYKNLLDKVSNLIEEARRKTVRYINTVIT